ncbi:hypothetical protein KZX45_07610 [Georgenia sp. EYE_87]|uniref:MmyB family transcriptional regulator n=1 Tax=Georgenia sp. EYE_87 TaxID=2853448 RepID=UPI0020058E21|nr:hypothetical protein [Georgenia sp. EYE_87]MCK6210405.1 hypothetical protein [Georgenia sp. EYE_87]
MRSQGGPLARGAQREAAAIRSRAPASRTVGASGSPGRRTWRWGVLPVPGPAGTCASHDVQFHRSGRKCLRHPVVGQLDLDFESMELPSEPDLSSTSAPHLPARPRRRFTAPRAAWPRRRRTRAALVRSCPSSR